MTPRRWTLIAGALLLALVAACNGGSDSDPVAVSPGDAQPSDATGASAAPTSEATNGPDGTGDAESSAVSVSFPTGPAVTVPQGYTYPEDHVDATGAYIPANGKPTLVWVDAIW